MAAAVPPAQFLGAPIKVITTFGQECEGDLFCYDINYSNSVILRKQNESDPSLVNYSWIKTNVIREVRMCSPSSSSANGSGDVTLPHVDLEYLGKKASTVEAQTKKNVHNWGVGVTAHAQEIFDELAKTMECRWDKEDILCFDVRITKPYGVENCSGGKDPRTLERVKKVLAGELQRIERRRLEKEQAPAKKGESKATDGDDGGYA